MITENNKEIIFEVDDELIDITNTVNYIDKLKIKKNLIDSIDLYGNEISITVKKNSNIEEYILSFINEEIAEEYKLKIEDILDNF